MINNNSRHSCHRKKNLKFEVFKIKFTVLVGFIYIRGKDTEKTTYGIVI